ncbi:hypothetical protein M5E88_11730 [Akkermansia muciniphila]|nr:hypothetical protein M5E88_11730 [Akkermansia muciniphila]
MRQRRNPDQSGAGRRLRLRRRDFHLFRPGTSDSQGYFDSPEKGVLSGVNVAAEVFRKVDPSLKVEVYLHDGKPWRPAPW